MDVLSANFCDLPTFHRVFANILPRQLTIFNFSIMKQILIKPDVLVRFQKALLLSFVLLFLGAAYILFGEVADKLNWNESAYVLLSIELASFAIAFAWAGIEYSKVLFLLESIKTQENEKASSLQQKLDQLSFREKTILTLILAGKSNKEICS